MKTITLATIATMVLALAPPALAQKSSSQGPDPATIVDMCDQNGDKALTKQEWNACGAPTPYPEAADTNKDGKVDAAELAAAGQ
ncbi:MAG: hypothetical protein HY243_01325 [Proteobacteria bacterium]|nr:hypothetical protein [Pseudomonadota bacterium]